jgi:hypothetical protein
LQKTARVFYAGGFLLGKTNFISRRKNAKKQQKNEATFLKGKIEYNFFFYLSSVFLKKTCKRFDNGF